MKLIIEVDTNNAAFEDPLEWGRIMQRAFLDSAAAVARIVPFGRGRDRKSLLDINGNTVGHWEVVL